MTSSNSPAVSGAVSMSTAKASSSRIPGLDGLRAFSILMVLIGHASESITAPPLIKKYLLPVIGHGHLGVMVFFIISGYLITSLLLKERERTGKIDLLDFYRRRSLRIFPAYYVFLVCLGILTYLGLIALPPATFLLVGTYTWNYLGAFIHQNNDSWFLGHFWTLAVEEQFYLLWPLTLIWLQPRRASGLALTLVCITPLIRLATYFLLPVWRPNLGNLLHTMWDSLMAGCFIALMQGQPAFEKAVQPVLKRPYLILLGVLLMGIGGPLLFNALGKYSIPYRMLVQMSGEIIAIGFLLLYVTRFPETSVGRFLNAKPVVFVGTLSYSLYLWQQLFLGPMDRPWKFAFPFNMVLIIGAALISYYLVEQPFLRMRHRTKSVETVPAREERVHDVAKSDSV